MHDFGVRLSAEMAGTDPQSYRSQLELNLSHLATAEQAVARFEVRDLESYRQAYVLKGVLGSTFCFAFNTRQPEAVVDRWSRVENALGFKMLRFVTQQRLPATLNRATRYLLWGRSFYADELLRHHLLDQLYEAGLLWRTDFEDGGAHALVTGLHTKLGDNVFTVGCDGKEYRQFVDCCVPQSFCLNHRDSQYVLTKGLKPIPPEFENIGFGDGKGCARRPRITQRDQALLLELWSALRQRATA